MPQACYNLIRYPETLIEVLAMPVKDIATILQPVVENLYLLEDHVTVEEEARALELAKEIRTIYDLAVERLKCGRVG